MSETVIFIVGVVVFALTVYGAVMAAGVAMTRTEIAEDPNLRRKVGSEELDKKSPFLKY